MGISENVYKMSSTKNKSIEYKKFILTFKKRIWIVNTIIVKNKENV